MRCLDLTGKRFGKLKVMGRFGEAEKRYGMWLCRCDCGGEVEASTRQLERGLVSDCGCVPKVSARRGNKAEDLTGRRFGKLTVLFRVPNRHGRVCWRCHCDCGREHVVSAHELKTGRCRSCGCEWRKKGNYYIDLTGRCFGRLTALYPTERRSPKKSVYWHCRCDCGNEVEVTEDGLRHGNYKSCGCLKAELQKNIHNQLHLVDGTCVEMLEKRKSRSDNTSGFRGVNLQKNGKYRASIGFKGRRFYLGTYDTMQEAVSVRMEAEEKIHDGFVKAYYLWEQRAAEDPDWGAAHPLHYEVEKINGEITVFTNLPSDLGESVLLEGENAETLL